MRDGLHQIIDGWMLVDDFDDLTARIEQAAEWKKNNEPLLPDEAATLQFMVDCQIARGFDKFGFGDIDQAR